jgi:hypothetical protein
MVLLFTVTDPLTPELVMPPELPPVTDPLENVTMPFPSLRMASRNPAEAATPLQMTCPVEVFRIPPATDPGTIVPEVICMMPVLELLIPHESELNVPPRTSLDAVKLTVPAPVLPSP